MKIFLDTSFIVGYAVSTDEHYNSACKLEKKGIFDNECYISNLIVNEIVTVIGNKSNLELAVNTYHAVKDNCIIVNEFDIFNFKNKVLDTYKDHNTILSFTDSSIIEVMKHQNIDKLVSFDTFFDKVDSIERIF